MSYLWMFFSMIFGLWFSLGFSLDSCYFEKSFCRLMQMPVQATHFQELRNQVVPLDFDWTVLGLCSFSWWFWLFSFFCLQFLVASGPHLPQFWYQNCILWGSDLTRLVLSTNMSNMLCTCIFCKIKNTPGFHFYFAFFSAAPCRSAWGLHFLDLHSSLMHRMSVLSTHSPQLFLEAIKKHVLDCAFWGDTHFLCISRVFARSMFCCQKPKTLNSKGGPLEINLF